MASGPSATAQPQLSEQAGKLRLRQGRLFTEQDEHKARRGPANQSHNRQGRIWLLRCKISLSLSLPLRSL
jgi:hypothetical protein